MELRTLEYFLTVAREENMTEAANVLHVTQPTLSRQIADLENELGRKLFTRTNRSTVLTEDGMQLRQRAEEIISLVQQTEDEMKNDDMELSGCIRIGAAETHTMHIIAELLAALHREHHGITCELFSGNADTVEERLEHGLLDFGLLLEPVGLEKYNYIRLPETDRLGILTRSDSAWAGKEYITPEDVRGMPLLLSSRTSFKILDLSEWSDHTLKAEDLNIVGSFDLIGNAVLLIGTGVTNAVSIDGLLQENNSSLKFIPFRPAISISAVLVWKKYRLLSKTGDIFLKRLIETCSGSDSSLSRE